MKRLDIDPEDVASCYQITETLQSCFPTKDNRIPRKAILNYLAACNMPVAINLLKSLKTIAESDRDQIGFEALCVYARINPLELLGAVVAGVREIKLRESALKSILAHPDVVQATIDAATSRTPLIVDGRPVRDIDGSIVRIDNGSHADRKLLHTAMGFLPTKKGSEIEINLFGRKEDKDDDDELDDDEQAWDDAFPLISGKLETWSDDRKRLTDGK